MARRADRGLTLAELLISLPIGLLVTGLILWLLVYAGRVYDSALRDSGARQRLEGIARQLEGTLDRTSSEGIHLSDDGKIIAVQPIGGVTATGDREWSETIAVYRYDSSVRRLYYGQVRLADLGTTPAQNLPQSLTPAQVLQAGATVTRVLANDVEQFVVSRQAGVPTMGVEITVVQESRLGKRDRAQLRTSFRLWSALDV